MHQTRSNSDILTRALTRAGAERVLSEEFWALAEVRGSVAVLRGRHFEVWALQQRPVCAYLHEIRLGARLGQTASGKLAQNPPMTLADAPPGILLSSPRETIPFLASYQQEGLPAAAASDAQLERSVCTYQSGEVALGMCGADSHVLCRVVGQHSRAHGQTGGKTAVTQRAKVGFRPHCSTVTHIAVPGSYSLGAHFPPKNVVTQLLQAYGP